MLYFIQSCQVDEGNQKAPQHNVIHLVLAFPQQLKFIISVTNKEIQRRNLISYSVTTCPTAPECAQVC